MGDGDFNRGLERLVRSNVGWLATIEAANAFLASCPLKAREAFAALPAMLNMLANGKLEAPKVQNAHHALIKHAQSRNVVA